MQILYLYAELMGYQIHVFDEYVRSYNAEVHVVHWDHKKLTPYKPPHIKGVHYYNRSQTSLIEILKICEVVKPDIVYISGWMDTDYLKAAKILKKNGVPIVTGFDDIWYGNIRQRIAALLFPIFYKKYFSHAWVSGPYQHEFAKRLGFKNTEIIYDLLSADTAAFEVRDKPEVQDYDKCFLYVGRLTEVKNIKKLVEGHRIYREDLNGTWNLVCVGDGPLKSIISESPYIKLIPFSSKSSLIRLAQKANAFVLASSHEPWGVVVHEFASVGLPLLLSNKIGSKPTFFIEGFNGLSFDPNTTLDIALKMKIMSDFSEEELNRMGSNSKLLAGRINVKISAASFVSLLKKYEKNSN